MAVQTAVNSQQPNHNAEAAKKAFGLFTNAVKPSGEELYGLGKTLNHPVLKIIGKTVGKVVETPFTEAIVDMYSSTKAKKSKEVIEAGVFPLNIVALKNTAKNNLKVAIAGWKNANTKILNENFFLRSRVQLVSDVADFIEKYNGSGDAKGLFDLINKYNAALASHK